MLSTFCPPSSAVPVDAYMALRPNATVSCLSQDAFGATDDGKNEIMVELVDLDQRFVVASLAIEFFSIGGDAVLGTVVTLYAGVAVAVHAAASFDAGTLGLRS